MRIAVLTLALFAGAAGAEPYHLIPGAVPLDSGPDGNTVVLDAPQGLIVFDTGRHRRACPGDHRLCQGASPADRGDRQQPLAPRSYDRQLGYPAGLSARRGLCERRAKGALEDLPQGQPRARRTRCSPIPRRRQWCATSCFAGARCSTIPSGSRRTSLIAKSGRMSIAGRHARRPSREARGDRGRRVALRSEEPRWRSSATWWSDWCPSWTRPVPTDGAKRSTRSPPCRSDTDPWSRRAMMDRADFLQWRTAYNDFVGCGRSSRPEKECIAGWERDAAKFIDPEP